jgi:heme oxygenase (biliverdin-IX-beta and delta-forming)
LILAALKERTRPLHNLVEGEVDMFTRMETPDEYARLLARLYGFYLPVETQLEKLQGFNALGIDLVRRRKSPLLCADLATLGWEESRIHALPLCVDLPALNTLSFGLGTLYVVEGATLGGQIIGRHLIRNLDITPDRGGRFFASYGSQVRVMWEAFGAAVKIHSNNSDVEASVVQSACETFATFIRWFQEEHRDAR